MCDEDGRWWLGVAICVVWFETGVRGIRTWVTDLLKRLSQKPLCGVNFISGHGEPLGEMEGLLFNTPVRTSSKEIVSLQCPKVIDDYTLIEPILSAQFSHLEKEYIGQWKAAKRGR